MGPIFLVLIVIYVVNIFNIDHDLFLLLEAHSRPSVITAKITSTMMIFLYRENVINGKPAAP